MSRGHQIPISSLCWIYSKVATRNMILNHDQAISAVPPSPSFPWFNLSTVLPLSVFVSSSVRPPFSTLVAKCSSPVFYHIPVRALGVGKAALLSLWVDTWLNGMCTAGKMILLQTAV